MLRLGHLGRASGILARRRAFEERLELRADQLGGKALPKHRAQEPAAVPSQIGMCDERVGVIDNIVVRVGNERIAPRDGVDPRVGDHEREMRIAHKDHGEAECHRFDPHLPARKWKRLNQKISPAIVGRQAGHIIGHDQPFQEALRPVPKRSGDGVGGLCQEDVPMRWMAFQDRPDGRKVVPGSIRDNLPRAGDR